MFVATIVDSCTINTAVSNDQTGRTDYRYLVGKSRNTWTRPLPYCNTGHLRGSVGGLIRSTPIPEIS